MTGVQTLICFLPRNMGLHDVYAGCRAPERMVIIHLERTHSFCMSLQRNEKDKQITTLLFCE